MSRRDAEGVEIFEDQFLYAAFWTIDIVLSTVDGGLMYRSCSPHAFNSEKGYRVHAFSSGVRPDFRVLG